MSPNKRSTDNLLRRYLNGALTAPEEAELERRALTDEPLAEAMGGLQAHPETDHEAHVDRMLQEARSRVQGDAGVAKIRPLRRNYARFAAAATVLLLIMAGALWFLPAWIEMEPGDMAMKSGTEATATAESAADAADEPETDADAMTMTADRETELPPPAPSSSTPNPRPRPNDKPPAALKTEVQARERAAAEAQRAQTARRETTREVLSAAAPQSDVLADEPATEEVVVTEAAPPIATAPMGAPEPFAAADKAADSLTTAATLNNGPAGNGGSRGDYLEGRITNENGVPVPNALVRLPGLPLGERTDSSGYFRLSTDATTSRLDVSHPDYEDETVDLRGRAENLQISLDRKEWQPESRSGFIQDAARSVIILDKKPGYAAPLEGYGTLRERLEANRPANVPAGKVKFSFTVNTDGTLTDFEFRGRPGRATMDYIGETLVNTSVWEIMQGKEPVRIHMKVVF